MAETFHAIAVLAFCTAGGASSIDASRHRAVVYRTRPRLCSSTVLATSSSPMAWLAAAR